MAAVPSVDGVRPPARRLKALGSLAVTPRDLAAYRDVFLLTDADLTGGPVLDCPAGASPFGAQVRALGGEAVSVDPAYADAAGLRERARADAAKVADWHGAHADQFDWTYLGTPEAVHSAWQTGIDTFWADFCAGEPVPDGTRYVAAGFPDLPFPDGSFSLALSGFLLFVYPELLGYDDTRDALLELARVTDGEVRVYPLHDTTGSPSPWLADLRAELGGRGVATEVRSTGAAWSSQPDSDRMLTCRREQPRSRG
jgi:hypothetical protein